MSVADRGRSQPGRFATPTESGSPAPALAPAGRPHQGIPRMPALFGRQPGPRQRPDRDGGYPSDVGSTLTTYVAVRADAAALSALLPADFTLAQPMLIAEAVSVTGLPWLAGRGYEVLLVTVPVTYRTPRGATYRGRLALVVWEDCPDAIISGREELGWSKVYADSMIRTAEGNDVTYTAAWGGTEFFRMNVTLSDRIRSAGTWREGPVMHYRVLPRTGEWGRLEVEQVTGAFPSPDPPPPVSLLSGMGDFRFLSTTFDRLPTLVHIVNTLAAIPLGEVVDAGQVKMAGWTDLADMKILFSYDPQPPATAPQGPGGR